MAEADQRNDATALDWDNGPWEPVEGVEYLTEEQSRALFDEEARRVAGMSGEEFVRRLHAGEFADVPDDPEHWSFWSLAAIVRPVADE